MMKKEKRQKKEARMAAATKRLMERGAKPGRRGRK